MNYIFQYIFGLHLVRTSLTLLVNNPPVIYCPLVVKKRYILWPNWSAQYILSLLTPKSHPEICRITWENIYILSIFLPASPELKMTVGDPPDPGRGGATGGGGGGGIGTEQGSPSVRQGGGGGGGGGGGTLGNGVLYDLLDTWKTHTQKQWILIWANL